MAIQDTKAVLTLKWVDDEEDACTISSQVELDEAIRCVVQSKTLETLKIHIFSGEPMMPGQRAPGETKDMYRKNARLRKKLKRIFLPKSTKNPRRPPIMNGHSFDNPLARSELDIQTIGTDIMKGTSVSNNFNRPTGTFGPADFERLKVIGRGSYAKVFLCKLKTTKKLYAMKVIKKELIADEDDVDWVNTEKKVFEQATNHPFLVGMHSCFQDPARLYFVIEFVNGGDLMFHMQKQRKLPEDHARFYSAEIVLALNFLHSRFVIYRDLKLDNVLLDSDGHIKLTDYGMCKEGMVGENAVTYTFCGTPNYIAPEILRGLPYGFSVDWWALGVLMFEMMAGKSPFDLAGIVDTTSAENTEEALFQVILERPIRMPRWLSVIASRVLKRFLDKEPGTRLGCSQDGLEEIKQDPFFKSLDWTRLINRQVIPPFKPSVDGEHGLNNFDTTFTEENPDLTPVNSDVIGRINQANFEDFEYNNPLINDIS